MASLKSFQSTSTRTQTGAFAKDEQQIKTGDMERTRRSRKRPPVALRGGGGDSVRTQEVHMKSMQGVLACVSLCALIYTVFICREEVHVGSGATIVMKQTK